MNRDVCVEEEEDGKKYSFVGRKVSGHVDSGSSISPFGPPFEHQQRDYLLGT